MATDRLWIFGYGSLIWDPGFPFDRRDIAVMHGYARSFCMWSIHHRGTPDKMGLVLALDEADGAACQGVAFRVETGAEDSTLDYLRERELISSAYLERQLPVRLSDGQTATATTFVIDAHHVQYCGGLPLEEQAQIIAAAVGGRGPNWEYLHNTADHLAELGIEDPDLVWLKARTNEILGH